VGRGLVFLFVDLPTDDGGHDVGDDVRMPIHVFSAPRLRKTRQLSQNALGDDVYV
jgi:hypothetical protein